MSDFKTDSLGLQYMQTPKGLCIVSPKNWIPVFRAVSSMPRNHLKADTLLDVEFLNKCPEFVYTEDGDTRSVFSSCFEQKLLITNLTEHNTSLFKLQEECNIPNLKAKVYIDEWSAAKILQVSHDKKYTFRVEQSEYNKKKIHIVTGVVCKATFRSLKKCIRFNKNETLFLKHCADAELRRLMELPLNKKKISIELVNEEQSETEMTDVNTEDPQLPEDINGSAVAKEDTVKEEIVEAETIYTEATHQS